MHVEAQLPGGTEIGIMVNETQRFATRSGPVSLTAGARAIIVAFRPSGTGSMWLGSWRYAITGVSDWTHLGLVGDVRHSDSMCRLAALHENSEDVSRTQSYACPPVSDPEKEIVLNSRTEGTFIVSKTWMTRMIRRKRKIGSKHRKKVKQ